MNQKKLSVGELTRLAFIGAERDARAQADAWPKDSDGQKVALNLAIQFNAYRTKRWSSISYEGVAAGHHRANRVAG